MLIAKNEGKACDAVLKRIEICSGETRSDLWHPELEQDGPPVDLRVTVGAQEYAIEHTLLQPYPNRIGHGAIFNRIHKFIRERIPNPLPGPVHYELHVPIKVKLPKGRRQCEQALYGLLEWVFITAQKLHERRFEVPPVDFFVNNSIRGQPKGFDQEFELFRWPEGMPTQREPGVLSMWFSALEDDEQSLKHALGETFDKKFPKLCACRSLNVRTILVLESFDPPFSHLQHIGNVLPELLAHRTDCPDEIYLVDIIDGRFPWWIWPLKRDARHWPTAGLPSLNGAYYELGQRPAEEMYEWYRQFYSPLGVSNHVPIPLEWHPAFFYEAELENLTKNKVKRPSGRPMP